MIFLCWSLTLCNGYKTLKLLDIDDLLFEPVLYRYSFKLYPITHFLSKKVEFLTDIYTNLFNILRIIENM